MSDDETQTFVDVYSASRPPPKVVRTKPPISLVVGRIVFELYEDETPKSCENFRALVRLHELILKLFN